MSKESVQAAARIASSLHIADLEEEDEVDRWLQAAADLIARDGKESSDLIYFEAQEPNEESIVLDFARLTEKFDARRNATLLAGEELELVAKRDDEHEEDEAMENTVFDADALRGALPDTIDVFGDSHVSMQLQLQQDDTGAAAVQGDGINFEAGRIKQALGIQDGEEVDQGPIPYGGKVYPGMPVRPRGMGTPRGDRLSGEIYRSAQTGEETPYGDGRQWGRFATQKKHYQEHEDLIKPDEEEGNFEQDALPK